MVYFFLTYTSYHIVEHKPHLIIGIGYDLAHKEARVALHYLIDLWLSHLAMYCVVGEGFENFGAAVHDEDDCVVSSHFADHFSVAEVVEDLVNLHEGWGLLAAVAWVVVFALQLHLVDLIIYLDNLTG